MQKTTFSSPDRQRPCSIGAIFQEAASVEFAATLTKKAMHSTFQSLERCARQNRWGAVTPKSFTQKQWSKFVETGLKAGNGSRTMQNQQIYIRRALAAVGRAEFADSVTNKDLGIPKGTRIGKGLVTDPEVLKQALERADSTTRSWIGGMLVLGLRQRELVRSGPSLKQWERQLSAGQPISLHDGAKGGRSRQIVISVEKREIALQTVRDLIEVVSRQDGRVVASKSLESACHMVSEKLAACGLFGKNSGHSLRRLFAVEQLNYYRRQGYDEATARSLVSNDLGHGDGRGTWVFNNYVRATERAAANDASAYEVAA